MLLFYFRKLGLVETITIESNLPNHYIIQPFQYLLVLDFESTCWAAEDGFKAAPEIIEFSVVLYGIAQNSIIEEFQQYIMPVENPKLSEFCKQLTGITQEQVDNGVPLKTCLILFKKWILKLKNMYNFDFPNSPTEGTKKIVFVTWSNWDLNTCFYNECIRKRIDRSGMFNLWIDLRALYREYYHRIPKGLKGALIEVSLKFEGKEHCALHDARNTAYLAGKMMNNGVTLRITKDISHKCHGIKT